ncbi:MAG: class II aldolase/adducin family protein, partial [Kiritimatiellae bacterium]|nr:class II aldolase/adducin family protein [Kiritimatiellia bacterium]
DALSADDIVLVELGTGRVAEGRLRPSSDTPTHLALYRAWAGVGGIVHTHSAHATAWAQARADIPCFGTTHADTFRGPVPCLPPLTREQLDADYEGNTGLAIAAAFAGRGLDPLHTPGVLCACHGPFTWGRDAAEAAEHAVALEEVARMAILTRQIDPQAPVAPDDLQDKHFQRKHGAGAYYGQSAKMV